MDYSDEDFYKAQAVSSNTQLYKQAGNGIAKAVLMAIFKEMM
jgi:DNA (cytosine-5)-methyltransferase 1